MKKTNLSPAEEQKIFEEMLSLYDDAEAMIETLKSASHFEKIKNFDNIDQLLNSLEENTQELVDAWLSYTDSSSSLDKKDLKTKIKKAIKNLLDEVELSKER